MAYNTEKCACNVRNEVCRFGLASSQMLGPSSYLKAFLGDGLVKHKTILIIPNYMETTNGKKKDGIFTTFGIRI